MFKVGAGLGSLGVALGLATAFAFTADAAPPETATTAPPGAGRRRPAGPDEEKRRELREVAIKRSSRARPRSSDSNGQQGRQARQDAAQQPGAPPSRPVRRARAREDGPDLRRAGRVRRRARTRTTRTRTPTRHTPGPATFNGPLHNKIPAPDRTQGQHDGLAGRLQPRRTTSSCTSAPATASSRSRRTTSASPRAATASTARSPTGSRSATTRRATAAATATRARPTSARNTLVPDPGRDRPVGRRPARRGPHRRADQGRAGDVLRPVGPQRLRPRRQLQRARRVHRPLPDRPRRRRPGRRRPAAGRGRDLVAPLEGVPRTTASRPGGQQGRRHADRQHRPLGRGLHDAARERRPLRVRARVRHDLGLPDEYDTAGPATTASTGGR